MKAACVDVIVRPHYRGNGEKMKMRLSQCLQHLLRLLEPCEARLLAHDL